MGLPLEREGNAGSHAPISNTAFFAMQDCIIGGQHGPVTFQRSFLSAGAEPGPMFDGFILGVGTAIGVGGHAGVPLDLPVGSTIVGCDSTVLPLTGNPVFRLELLELIRPIGVIATSETNINNFVASSPNSVSTTNSQQRLIITKAMLNNGAGVPVRNDANYFLRMTFVSGANYTFAMFNMRWTVQRKL